MAWRLRESLECTPLSLLGRADEAWRREHSNIVPKPPAVSKLIDFNLFWGVSKKNGLPPGLRPAVPDLFRRVATCDRSIAKVRERGVKEAWFTRQF